MAGFELLSGNGGLFYLGGQVWLMKAAYDPNILPVPSRPPGPGCTGFGVPSPIAWVEASSTPPIRSDRLVQGQPLRHPHQ